MRELKECTFIPRINKSYSHKNISNIEQEKSSFDKLYKDSKKYQLSKEMKIIDHSHLLGEKISFNPEFKCRKKNKILKNLKNFEQRQKDYLDIKNKKRENLQNEINSNIDKICSFSPKIIQNNQILNPEKTNGPVFKRLYQDGIERKNFKEQKNIEDENKFINMSNMFSQKKLVDYDALNKLYESNKAEVINRAKEKVEKEEGITFQPNIGNNPYIANISGNFYERNEQFLIDKKNFIEEENKKQMNSWKNNNINQEYTKEERTEIVNNIIKRLYNNNNNQTNSSKLANVEGSKSSIQQTN
jgi:hypothetical protein